MSIEKSELLSEILKKNKIDHHVLNARFHEQEAFIIAQAGQPRAVTIATNMAGRGTDIKLGGNVEMQVEQQRLLAEGQSEKKRRPDRQDRGGNREAKNSADGVYVIGTNAEAVVSTTSFVADRDARGPRPFEILPVAGRRPDAPMERIDTRVGKLV